MINSNLVPVLNFRQTQRTSKKVSVLDLVTRAGAKCSKVHACNVRIKKNLRSSGTE
jgi:hypothetical protein